MTLDERIHALVFNGITHASAESDGFDSWLPLSERERFTRAVLDELRRGNIEFRLGPLALLADAAATESGLCSKCGGKLTACADCGHPALCGEAHCQAHMPDGGWDAHPLSETYPGSGIYE